MFLKPFLKRSGFLVKLQLFSISYRYEKLSIPLCYCFFPLPVIWAERNIYRFGTA